MNFQFLGYLGFFDASFQHRLNSFPASVQLVLLIFATFSPTKFSSFCLSPGESFFRALADEVSFNLCREAEGKGQDLALDVFAKSVVVLDSPYLTFLGHTDVKDFHNHEEVSTQPGKFCADDEVVFLNPFEEFSEFPFVVVLSAADGFFNPTIDVEFILGAEVVDFKPLILHGLFVTAYSYISVNHNIKYFTIYIYPVKLEPLQT